MNYLDMFLENLSEAHPGTTGMIVGGIVGGIQGGIRSGVRYLFIKRKLFKRCESLRDPERINQCKQNVKERLDDANIISTGTIQGVQRGGIDGSRYAVSNYLDKHPEENGE